MNNESVKNIDEIKRNYVDEIRGCSTKYRNIVIYGAGIYGKAIYNLLRKNAIEVTCFVVTDKCVNAQSVMGLDVYAIDEINMLPQETLFLIGVKKTWNLEVIATLNKKGYTNIIGIPDSVERFWEKIDTYERPILEITPKIGCSINCRYCPQELLCKEYYVDKKRKSVMTFEDFKLLLDKTPDDLILDFSGYVEPFLNKDADRMMLYANSIGRDIALYTTLVGVTPEIFNRIKEIPFYTVVVHVPDKYNYANIPMTDEYFEVLDMAIEAFKPNGKPFIDNASSQSEPHPDVIKHIGGRMKVYWNLNDRAGNLEGENLFKVHDIQGRIRCRRAKNTDHFVLLPDGSLTLCCNDFGLKHIVGNLMIQTYEEIINGEKFTAIKNSMQCKNNLSIICRDCKFAEVE